MPMLDAWREALEQMLVYASFCLSHPMQAPACRPFWTWLMIGALTLGALLILIMAWSFISYRRKAATALSAQEEPDRMPDEETLDAVRWVGEKVYSCELSDAEIDHRIREAVSQRRLARQS